MSIRSSHDEIATALTSAERVLDQIIETLTGSTDDDALAQPRNGLQGEMESTAARARRILTAAERISLLLFEATDSGMVKLNVPAQFASTSIRA